MSHGRKTLILGSPGSGKSTLAARLGAIYKISPVDLDDIATIAYSTGEKPRPAEPLVTAAKRLSQQDQWIAEGIYTTWTRPLVASADCVVVLRTPLATCLWRIVRRHLLRGIHNEHGGLVRLAKFCFEVIDYHRNPDPDAIWTDNPDRTTLATTLRLASEGRRSPVILASAGEIDAWLRSLAS